jgi:hypothetical protein
VGSHLTAYRALRGESPELAAWYFAGCQLLGSPNVPDHLALAGHEIREVIEKLVRMARASSTVTTPELGDAVKKLRRFWPLEMLTQADGAWPENLLPKFLPFLREAQNLFAPDGASRPRKESEVANYLDWRDPSPARVTEQNERLRIRGWTRLRGFFVGVSHHQIKCNATEFDERLQDLDRLVLEALGPQTFGDFSVIDHLLKEAGE